MCVGIFALPDSEGSSDVTMYTCVAFKNPVNRFTTKRDREHII